MAKYVGILSELCFLNHRIYFSRVCPYFIVSQHASNEKLYECSIDVIGISCIFLLVLVCI